MYCKSNSTVARRYNMKRIICILSLIIALYCVHSYGQWDNQGGKADDTAYGVSWDGSKKAATQNALYDIISTFTTQMTLSNAFVFKPAASTDGHTFIIQAYGTDGSNNPELKNVITCTNDTAATANNLPECSIDNVDLSLPVLSVLTIPQSDDPDVSATGQISLDTDGWLRVYQGSAQKAIPLTQPIVLSAYKPQDMDDAQRDHYWMYVNTTGMSLVITKWTAKSTSDDTTLTLYEEDGDGQNDTTIAAVEVATNGTGLYYATDSTFTPVTIEDGHIIYADFDNTDAPAQFIIVIDGHWLADVN
jgi:hypothetical protein